jgi:uncharacterized secreted repeat protein (TIGR03808 family)
VETGFSAKIVRGTGHENRHSKDLTMNLGRRDLMLGSLGAGVALAAAGRPAEAAPSTHSPSSFGLTPAGGRIEQTASVQDAIDRASASATPLFLPAGVYSVARLDLKPGIQIQGVSGQSILRLLRDDAVLSAQGIDGIQLRGLVLDGAKIPMQDDAALLQAVDTTHIDVANCRFINSSQNGIVLRGSSGRISQCEIADIRKAGVFSNDAGGLEVIGNHVHDCGDNGIQIWRSKIGEDGTLVQGNRVERIKTMSGGSGQNGNGINVFRAGSVIVSGNRVSDCAYSAIRNNSGGNCQIIGNSCARLGEVAVFAEFAFDGAIIAENVVDTAATGISVTNFNVGGHLAVVQGNLIRNIFWRKDFDNHGVGIAVEADCAVTGNIIDTVPGFGLFIGWHEYLRDICATGNLIRNCGIGIGVSVDFGAGHALLANNMITGSKNGAIRGMHGVTPAGSDLAAPGAKPYSNLVLSSNVGI